MLTAGEAAELSDRVYQVRCAAEDVATAVGEGASAAELRRVPRFHLRSLYEKSRN